MVILCITCSISMAENMPVWRLIGPGDVDQVSSLTISKKGIVYLGTTDGGVYHSIDYGDNWTPLTHGIKNYDITTPVLVDPDDDMTLYVGTRGGFYKSNDGGKRWQAKWKGISSGKPNYSNLTACIGSIALDPVNTNIIYMGFGHGPSLEGTQVVQNLKWSGDIYKSSDKGETWTVISSLGEGAKIRHIEVISSNTIYISTNSGLFKSEDAGKSWKKILNISTKSTATHPDNPEIVYVAAGEEGVYKSLDSGKQWTKIIKGLTLGKGTNPPLTTDNYTQIVVDTKNSNILYLINSTWGSGGGVYRSSNSGNSWEKITKWQWERNANIEVAWLESSRRVNAIAIDPQNTNRIFIGTSKYIYKTENKGNSWQQLISRKVTDDTWTHKGINNFGHTRVVGIDPIDSDRLYIGTADHGLVKSIDGGKSWKQSVKGMEYKHNIYDIAIDAKNPGVIYVINGKAGFKVAGVAKSYDYGENWKQLNGGLKDVMYYTILLDNENSDIVYIGGEDGVYKTENGGGKLVYKNKGLEDATVRKLVFHPKNKHIIFAATDRGLYKSVDDSNSWTKTHEQEMNFYTFVIDPHNSNTLYAGAVQDGTRKLQGGIFKSTDGGKKWKKILYARRIESMALIPTQPAILYAFSNDFQYHDESCGEGVFRSIDDGLSWESVNDGLPVLRGFNINIGPKFPYKIYLSSNGSGVYVSIDPTMNYIIE